MGHAAALPRNANTNPQNDSPNITCARRGQIRLSWSNSLRSTRTISRPCVSQLAQSTQRTQRRSC
eukprot:5920793-Pyramimonas_sp.AAC.1